MQPKDHGFTLIELMVAVAVLAILLTAATPSFTDALVGVRLSAYANDLVASATQARSEAIKRNAVVTLCASTDGTNCASGGWEQGWILKNVATGEVFLRQPATASGIKITDTLNGVSSIAFQPTGVGATQASLRVCRATPAAGRQERIVDINATGRAWVTRTATGVCS